MPPHPISTSFATAPKYDTRLGGYQTDITESELRDAPGFPGDEHDWSDREREEQLHDYYRIPPYWRAI
jgi:hypothetical protein